MKLRDVHIRSLGVYLPPEQINGDRAITLGWYGAEFPNYDVTGVHVADGTPAVDMAVYAGRQALNRAGLDPGEIDLLVHAAHFWQGPEGWCAVGYILRELGCGRCAGQELRQGCNGILAGLEVAAGLLALSGGPSTAMITAAQSAASPWLDRWRSAGPGIVLGDGATAAVLCKDRGFARVDSVNSLMIPELEQLHRGALSLAEPDPPVRAPLNILARMMEFAVTTRYELPKVYSTVIDGYTTVMNRSMAEAGIDTADLTRVIFSHVSPSMTDRSVMKPLGLPMSKTTWDFARTVGHLGPADHTVSLEHLVRSGQVGPGDHVLMVGGSAGYNVAAAVITVTDDPQWTDEPAG
jgi:3-oxoacyl-[acyl-carrier-protein] synthase III